MNRKVSIIMGVYNCEKTVERAISSIKNQTFLDWELIICDDCSTDKTYDVIKSISKDDDRIVVLQNQCNSKLAATLNRCLEYANGQYIARMDADDIAYKERLELQVQYLDSHRDFDVVGAGADIFDGDRIVATRYCKQYPTKEDVLFGPPFIHPTIMIRESVMHSLNGYTVAKRTQRGQDWDLWFKFFAAGYRGYNIQKPLIVYHESRQDMKKRTFSIALDQFKNAIHGYKNLDVPAWKYIYTLKPIISFLLPQRLKSIIRHEGKNKN